MKHQTRKKRKKELEEKKNTVGYSILNINYELWFDDPWISTNSSCQKKINYVTVVPQYFFYILNESAFWLSSFSINGWAEELSNCLIMINQSKYLSGVWIGKIDQKVNWKIVWTKKVVSKKKVQKYFHVTQRFLVL